jgi:hypothetical protein
MWGGHNKIDYLLSVDMAKEIAMVENNEKGREIRRYLIEVEKEFVASLKRERQASLEREAVLRSLSEKHTMVYGRYSHLCTKDPEKERNVIGFEEYAIAVSRYDDLRTKVETEHLMIDFPYPFFRAADALQRLEKLQELKSKGDISTAEFRKIVLCAPPKNSKAAGYSVWEKKEKLIDFFVKNTFNFTGDPKDRVIIAKACRRYAETVPEPASRNIFTRFIKRQYPHLPVRVMRAEGVTVRVFISCRMAEQTEEGARLKTPPGAR